MGGRSGARLWFAAALVAFAGGHGLAHDPTQQATLVAPDSTSGDQFGRAVAVDGDVAVIGASQGDAGPTLTSAGAAYVCERSGGVWGEPQRLTPSPLAAGDLFGSSVAVSGETIVVGARAADPDGLSVAGAAYVFTRSSGAWSQQARLVASDGVAGDNFGWSVSVDGDIAVVGAYRADVAGMNGAGAAYVFTRNGSTWTQQGARLTEASPEEEAQFGECVAVDGETVVVTRATRTVNFGSLGINVHFEGRACVFTRGGGQWTQQGPSLMASVPIQSADHFGESVDIDGDTIIVGAPGTDALPTITSDNAGVVYVYTRSAGVWSERSAPVPSDRSAFDLFGTAVAVQGDAIVVGASGQGPSSTGPGHGAAYEFRRDGAGWTQHAKIGSPEAVIAQFGAAAALDGDTVVIGAWQRRRAYVFTGLATAVPGDLVWETRVTAADAGTSVATFPDGSSVVTGRFGISSSAPQTGFVVDGAVGALTTSGGTDVYVARFDANGDLVWAIAEGGVGNESGVGVAAFPDGSLIVSCQAGPGDVFGDPGPSPVTLPDGDWALARYHADGSLDWVRWIDSALAFGVSAFPDGSSVVTGRLAGGTARFDDGAAGEAAVVSTGFDTFVARYHGDGRLAWVRRDGGAGTNQNWGNGVTAVADGSSVVVGQFQGTATFGQGEANEQSLTSAGGFDVFVARYDALGAFDWARSAGGTNHDMGNAVTAFPDGSCVATGELSSSTATFGAADPAPVTLTSATGVEGFIVRYDAAGTLAWARPLAKSPGTAIGLSVSGFPDGSSVCTGSVQGSLSGPPVFGPGESNQTSVPAPLAASTGPFIARYNSDGTLAWARGIAFTTSAGNGVAACVDGSAIVTGGATVANGFMFLRKYAGEPPASPPTVEISSPAAGSVVGAATLAVTATVTHPAATTVTSVPAGVSASLPAGGGTATGLVPLASEGPNTITVSAADAFGNVGGTSVEVIRDTTAPGIVVTSPAAGAVVGTSPVDVTVEVTDLTATTLDVGGGAAALPAGGGSATVSVALASGPNDVAILVTDAAGNATTVHHSIVLDLEAPVVTIESPLDGERFGPGGSPVAVTARVDDLSATSVSSAPAGVSDSLPAGGGVAVGAVALAEGSNTITVTATDATGQMASDAVTVVLDTTAPSVAFAAPQDGDAVRGTIDVHLAADDPLPGSGVASVAVTIDGSPLVTLTAAPFETSLDTTTLADGPHVLAATATDGLGNSSAAVSLTVLVDNTPPVVAIVLPADGSVASGLVPIEVSIADATSGVVAAGMTVAGVAPTTDGGTTYAVPVAADTLHGSEASGRWPDGPTPFAASARDAAGNVATASVSVEIDNTQPAKDLVRPQDGDVVSGTMAIEAAAADPHLASLTLLVDGAEVATSSTSPLVASFDTTTRLDGPMTVELRVADTAGNTSTCTAQVTVDNVAFTLQPSLLHLKSNGGGAPADADLAGPNLALLLPTESHAIELRVPGGNSIPAEQGWDGDDALSGPGLTRLRVRFSRAALVASVRAGIAGGQIDGPSRQVLVTLVADGRVQGTTVLGFTEGK